MHNAVACAVVAWIGVQAVTAVQARQAPERDFSCTSFPADLSEAELVERYSRSKVRRAEVFGTDDGPQDGTVVFDDSPLKLEAAWLDPKSRLRLAWIRTREIESPWLAPNGVAIGIDLRSLEERNGWPFRLAALGGPEGRGVIRSWGGGRLQSATADDCVVSISLQPTGDRRIDPALSKQVFRGSGFSSGHPAMQAINPRVAALMVAHRPKRPRAAP